MPVFKAERCSDVRPVPLAWLWPRYLARGKLALLDGDPEMGKSLLTINLIARLGNGGYWPDGSEVGKPGTSILLSAEDDAADTIRPRAEAAGADLDRLILPTFAGRAPRLPDDLLELEGLVQSSGAALLVIDPLTAFLPPGVAANLDQCVRQALTPLAGLAARTACAVLFLRHLTKTGKGAAVRRGQGSMGIVAAVRTAWLAVPNPADPTRRLLTVAKSNVGRRPPSLGYRVAEAQAGQPGIEWLGPVDLTADEACREMKSTAVRTCERATDWLRRELASGPRTAASLYAAAAEAGIPERTLEQKKSALGTRSHRTYDYKAKRGEWYWYDTDVPWPKDAPFPKPWELEPLEPLGPL